MKIFNFYATMQVSTLYHALVVAREENGLKRPIIGVNLSIPFVPRELDAVKVTMKGFFPGVLLTGCESRMWVLLCVLESVQIFSQFIQHNISSWGLQKSSSNK